MKLLIRRLGENESLEFLGSLLVEDLADEEEGDGLDVFVAGNVEEGVPFLVPELARWQLVVFKEAVESIEVFLFDQ
jgi:hypothetical protein